MLQGQVGEYLAFLAVFQGIVAIKDTTWKWWRNDQRFSQRFTCTISADSNTIVSKGEMSKDGGPWEGDLELTYTRVSTP